MQIPISEFKRSSCLVDQSFQALALCGLQLVPFVREFPFVKLIYDYMIIVSAFCDEEDLT